MPIRIIKRAEVTSAPSPVVEGAAVTKPTRVAVPIPEPTLDAMCKDAIESDHTKILPWFLIGSYLYYVHDKSVVSDGMYDAIAKTLLEMWPTYEHQHKALITEDDLKAGSAFKLKAKDYPTIIRYSAKFLIGNEWGVIIDPEKDCAEA